LIGAVVSTKGGARLCGSFTHDPKFFGKFENLFAKRFSRKILTSTNSPTNQNLNTKNG